MSSTVSNTIDASPALIGIVTVSDRASRGDYDDRGGPAIHHYLDRVLTSPWAARPEVIPDNQPTIEATIRALATDGCCLILTTGGTGPAGRDVTPEAMAQVWHKEIPGFGELFRMLSYQKIGTSTMQSRACAGVCGGSYFFALPGSPGACKDAWDEILRWQLDYRHRACNLIEIMPRLEEHKRRK